MVAAADMTPPDDPSALGVLGARLLLVCGKGGVGRSTWTAACARRVADDGGRVLAIDAAGGAGLARALGVPPGTEPGDEIDIDGVTFLELDTRAALDEYVRLNLRVPVPADRLGPIARIFDYVAAAAPGVREILTIGKIAHEVRARRWDLVVVDAPATGHVIELIDAPRSLDDVVGVGPLVDQTSWMQALLLDGDITRTLVVTTLEELPVSETNDLVGRLVEIGQSPIVVANRAPAALSDAATEALSGLAAGGTALGAAASLVLARSTGVDAALDELPADRLGLVVGELEHPVADLTEILADAGWSA